MAWKTACGLHVHLRSAGSTSPRSQDLPCVERLIFPLNTTNPSAIGTILSTIGIAVAASGGDKKAAPSKPAPAAKDTSITGADKEEEELYVYPFAVTSNTSVRQFVAAAEDSN